MKPTTTLSLVALAALFLAGSLAASAQSVTAINQSSGDTLPGQGGTVDPDYSFFGPFNPGGGNGPQTLTDFTEQDHGFNGDSLPTINAPAGSENAGNPITTVTAKSVILGEEFFAQTPADLVDFTVLSTAASAYDVSILFGIVNNGTNGEYIDQSITLTIDNSGGTQLATGSLNVTDNNTSDSTGFFANFELAGLAAGDVIHVSATPGEAAGNVQVPYIGAAGFTAVQTPEPSTYALVAVGLGALLLAARRVKLV